jgi:hypothetical protein
MANVYLLNLSQDYVTLGNVFDSFKTYIVKDPIQPDIGIFSVTKILDSSSLRVYQETNEGILYNAFTDISKRQSLGPNPPIKGPFIENYSINGNIKTEEFINLLLIDKPPVRTGFFQFTINNFSFTGIIRQTTNYVHYDWQKSGSNYSYTLKDDTLGYAIEISKNQLYTAEQNEDGTYSYSPTALNLELRKLTGGETIISEASLQNPNTYLQSIPGANSKISGVLPESIFYISPEYALRYIASYTDLIDQFGSDYEKGQQHYARYGLIEGRSITFNPISYLNKYLDLRTLYGYDTYNATIHYITIGYYEGRTIDQSSEYNPLTGGLYDGRVNSALTENTIVFPIGPTLKGRGKDLNYRNNSVTYILNNNLNFDSAVLYMKVQ